MDAEFDADALVECTLGIVQRSLDERKAVVTVVVDCLVQNMQQFQADLREQGLAEHPSIVAMYIMQQHPTVQQVMSMASHLRRAVQSEDLSAGEDPKRQRQRSETPPQCLGLPESGRDGCRDAWFLSSSLVP